MKYKLKSNAKIFTEIVKQDWWSLFTEDNEFYINIRKDNYISVYYRGGSVAKIEYKNDIITAQIHEKYLGNAVGERYVDLDLGTLNRQKLLNIKELINQEYLSRKSDERRAEKWIQGDIIINDSNCIDSEFAYNRDSNIGRLRVDIIQLNEGKLRLIELKGIYNSELMTKNPAEIEPHIVEQITRYRNFIEKYREDIIKYYQTLCDIKVLLGIGEKVEVKSIDLSPFLWIQDTYNKETKGRITRIANIESLLKNYNITYKICK